MVSSEQVKNGLKLCRHVKPLHRLDRELVVVMLVKNHLQYFKEHKDFLCVNVGESFPLVQIIKKVGNDFVCDCDKANFSVRVPDLASCAHEASLWVAFKIGYFKEFKG